MSIRCAERIKNGCVHCAKQRTHWVLEARNLSLAVVRRFLCWQRTNLAPPLKGGAEGVRRCEFRAAFISYLSNFYLLWYNG